MDIRLSSNVRAPASVDDRSQTSPSETHTKQPGASGTRSRNGVLQPLSRLSAALRPSGAASHRPRAGELPTASSTQGSHAASDPSQRQATKGSQGSAPTSANGANATQRRTIATSIHGQSNRRPVTLLNVDGAALAHSIGSAGKAVRRFARRLTMHARPASQQARQAAKPPVALNVPRDYGWPLGLLERQRLEKLPPDAAYEQAFRTHTARVGAAVAKSAEQRFGHTHIDDETLRAQLHAWANGEDGPVENDDVPWQPESESETESETGSESASEIGHDDMSPEREPEIQSVHSSPGQPAASPDKAGPSRTRRVQFVPQAEAREIDDESHALKSPVARPVHAPQRASAKLKGHTPESPESHRLYRQRSINGAAWDTVQLLKSPRAGATEKEMAEKMLKQNKLLFTIKNDHKLASEDEPAALKVFHALDRETRPPSFAGKIKGLVRQLQGKDPAPGKIAVLGEDTRAETLQRVNNR